jgi:peptidoglycan/LPS O-acetylase OafA/YrhL
MKCVEFGYRSDLLKRGLSSTLDTLRWASALAVCAAHTRNLLFPDAAMVPHMNHFVQLFYFLTLFGTQAVVVFFVLSGLLIGGGIVAKARKNNFDLQVYAIDRLTRLYIVLIPAVILSVCLFLFVGSRKCNLDLIEIVGNGLLLQNVFVRPLCNNHPLWSLSNEGMYYVLAGLAVVGYCGNWFRRSVAIALLCGLTMTVVIVSTCDREDVLISAPLWMIGIAPWFVKINIPSYILAIIFSACLVVTRMHFIANPILEDWLLAVTLTAALCSGWKLRSPGGARLAKFSYSLYLIHMPIAQTLASFIGVGDPDSIYTYINYFAATGAVVFCAWLFGGVFENRTDNVRKAIKSWIEKRGQTT